MKDFLDKFKKQLKGAYKSWTIWFNSVGILMLSAALADPMTATYLTANGFTAILLIGNLILRFKTASDLADK